MTALHLARIASFLALMAAAAFLGMASASTVGAGDIIVEEVIYLEDLNPAVADILKKPGTNIPGGQAPVDRPAVTCEGVEKARAQGHQLLQVILDWYADNCNEEGPHALTCDDYEESMAKGVLFTQGSLAWYNENCRGEPTCEDYEEGMANGVLFTQGSLAWYDENCRGGELTCQEYEEAIANGVLFVQGGLDWYYDNCIDNGDYRCRELQYAIDQGLPLTIHQQAFYDRRCRAELTCKDILEFVARTGQMPSGEAKKWYEEHCQESGQMTCEEVLQSAARVGQLPTGELKKWYEENCEPTCDYILKSVSQNGQWPGEKLMKWYQENCQESGQMTCEEVLQSAARVGKPLTGELKKWYEEHCEDSPDGRYTCRDLERALKDGLRLTADAREYYERNCDRDELRCRELEHAIAQGLRLTDDARQFYNRFCTDEGFTCRDLERALKDGLRLTADAREYYDRYCDYPEYTCEELLELGILSEAEYKKLCSRDDNPLCLDDCDDGDTPGREDDSRDPGGRDPGGQQEPECDDCRVELECEGDCVPPLPPRAGTGAIFDAFNRTNGLGFASVILIALGGAVAGVVLRRKS
jgi:hypothetical protein